MIVARRARPCGQLGQLELLLAVGGPIEVACNKPRLTSGCHDEDFVLHIGEETEVDVIFIAGVAMSVRPIKGLDRAHPGAHRAKLAVLEVEARRRYAMKIDSKTRQQLQEDSPKTARSPFSGFKGPIFVPQLVHHNGMQVDLNVFSSRSVVVIRSSRVDQRRVAAEKFR